MNDAHTQSASESEKNSVGVLRVDGEFKLINLRHRSAGERLFRLEGDVTTQPSQHSVQIDEGLHLDLNAPPSLEDTLDRFFWRFMNHSCEPNSRLVGRELFALRAIEPWEPVTFDYNTTEWNIAHPFRCRCGSARCLGEIRGYKHLSPDQRHSIDSHAAAHVRRLAAASELDLSK